MAGREPGNGSLRKLETGITIAAIALAGVFFCRDCMKEGRMGPPTQPADVDASAARPVGAGRLGKPISARNPTLVSHSAMIDALSSMFPRNSLDCADVPMRQDAPPAAHATDATRLSVSLRDGVRNEAGEINGWARNIASCISAHGDGMSTTMRTACSGVEMLRMFEREPARPTSTLLEGLHGEERIASLAAILHYMEYLDPNAQGVEGSLMSGTYDLRERYLLALASGADYGPDLACLAKRRYLVDLSIHAVVELGEMIEKRPFLAEGILAAVPESQRAGIIEAALPDVAFMESPDFTPYSELFSVLSWQNRVALLDKIHQMDAEIVEPGLILEASERLLASKAAPELKDAVRRYAQMVGVASSRTQLDDSEASEQEDDGDSENDKIEEDKNQESSVD